MISTDKDLSPSSATGSLGIMHLKRYWGKSIARKKGKLAHDALQEEWNTDITMLAALGLGLEQTIKYVFHSVESFETFEQWVLDVNDGKLVQQKIDEFNRSVISGVNVPDSTGITTILSADDINFWNENGYVIIRHAVPKEDCEATIDIICEHINIKKEDPTTWYNEHPAKQGIMVQLFQHPFLEKNRQSEKIKLA